MTELIESILELLVEWPWILGFLLVIAGVVGWISNIVWTYHQTDIVKVLLGVLGALVAPIGAIHGLFCL